MIDLAKLKQDAAMKRDKNMESYQTALACKIGSIIFNELVDNPSSTKAYLVNSYFMFEDSVYNSGDILYLFRQNGLWNEFVEKFKAEGVALEVGGLFNNRLTITWS